MARHGRHLAVILTLVAAATACGGDDEPTDTTAPTTVTSTPTSAPPTTTAPTTTAPTTTVPSTTSTSSTTPTTLATTTTAPAGLEQPAIWPAADTVFTTPQEAAADFVSQVLQVPPVLGEFMAGDSRSGEIELLSPSEGGGTPVPRSLLLLRQLGPSDGWFVLAAISPVATIDTPSGDVAAGPVEVAGTAMGFEATIIIEAFRPGDPEPLDRVVTMAGEMGVAGPYRVSLDLSDAQPGETIAIVVRGSTGLETDPGDVGAVAVRVAA